MKSNSKIIKAIVSTAAEKHGLKMKNPDHMGNIVLSYLQVFIDGIFSKLKNFIEDDLEFNLTNWANRLD